MTPGEAQEAWSKIQPMLEERLLAVRPKLKSFEAHLALAKAREACQDDYQSAQTFDELRVTALTAFPRAWGGYREPSHA